MVDAEHVFETQPVIPQKKHMVDDRSADLNFFTHRLHVRVQLSDAFVHPQRQVAARIANEHVQILMYRLSRIIVTTHGADRDHIAMGHRRVVGGSDLVRCNFAEVLLGTEEDDPGLHQRCLERHNLMEERSDSLKLAEDLLRTALRAVGD